MTGLNRWLYSLLGTIGIVAASYQWVDRRISVLAKSFFPTAHHPLAELAFGPDPVAIASVAVFVGTGFWALSGRCLPRFAQTGMLCSIAATMAQGTKNILKLVFGRTWPETWIDGNSSFLQNGTYGFHFFHGGAGYGSFPSGHAAVVFSVLTIAWVTYPEFRGLYYGLATCVALTLVVSNLHFVSDVIAGAFLGASIGWIVIATLTDRRLAC